MNRTDRLLALVLELQRGGARPRSAVDLAAVFETSKRTIYRDMQALAEAGVPVISTPGQGYTLSEDYFLPPLRFTADEATLLLLGVDVMTQSFDAQYRLAAEAAARKIEAVLPQRLRPEVAYLRANLIFVEAQKDPATADLLRQLRGALLARHSVRFRYFARYGARDAVRTVDPYSLGRIEGHWYLIAYDQGRRGLRHFRLDRIEGLVVTGQTFQRRADFSAEEPAAQALPLVVRVRLSAAVARWARESRPFFFVHEQADGEALEMTLRVRDEAEVLDWVLSWGQQAEVLEPASLRARVAAEAQGMAALYSTSRP
mgnify:CR=1 FL=1